MENKTYSARLAELKDRHEKETKKLMAEGEYLNALDELDAPMPRFIHVGGIKQYGYECTLAYGDYRTPVSMDEIDEICKALKPIPLAYAQDTSYKYFVPHDVNTAISGNENTHTFFEIYPCWLALDGFSVKLKYFAYLKSKYFADLTGKVVEVSIQVSENIGYGKLFLTGHVKLNPDGTVSGIENRGVGFDGVNFRTSYIPILDDDETYLGEFENDCIQYAAGSRSAWHSAKVYAHMVGGLDLDVYKPTHFLKALS